MTKKTDKKDVPANDQSEVNENHSVMVNVQYIKDFSFENPGAPESLLPSKEAPKINVGVDVGVKKLEDKTYEVTLITSAEATRGDDKLFMAELSYAGVFTLNIPEKDKEPALMVYCPGLLFPYARQIISEVTRQGNFPPLLIDPIDFGSLYVQYKQRQAAEGAEKKEDK